MLPLDFISMCKSIFNFMCVLRKTSAQQNVLNIGLHKRPRPTSILTQFAKYIKSLLPIKRWATDLKTFVVAKNGWHLLSTLVCFVDQICTSVFWPRSA